MKIKFDSAIDDCDTVPTSRSNGIDNVMISEYELVYLCMMIRDLYIFHEVSLFQEVTTQMIVRYHIPKNLVYLELTPI